MVPCDFPPGSEVPKFQRESAVLHSPPGLSDSRGRHAGQTPLTSALYMRMRPWFTLDQEGTALMFHSWLECSAKGPVFIWKKKSRN